MEAFWNISSLGSHLKQSLEGLRVRAIPPERPSGGAPAALTVGGVGPQSLGALPVGLARAVLVKKLRNLRLPTIGLAAVAVILLTAGSSALAAPSPDLWSGSLTDVAHFRETTDSAGNHDRAFDASLRLSLLFKLVSGSEYTLSDGRAGYAAPVAAVQDTEDGRVCTTTWKIDTTRALTTGSLTLQGDSATITVDVPKTVHDDCSGTTTAVTDVYRWSGPLAKLPDGEAYKLGVDSGYDTPSGPNFGPAHHDQTGTLYAGQDWYILKLQVKEADQKRLSDLLTASIVHCEDQAAALRKLGIPNPDITSCVASAEAAYDTDVAKIDPVDRSYTRVALPRRVPLPAERRARCPAGRRARALCKRFFAAQAADDRAIARLIAIQAAIDATLNRGNTAVRAHSRAGQELQAWALAVLAGEEQRADAHYDASGRALAAALRAVHDTARLSTPRARRQERRLIEGDLPPAVMAALAKDGISRNAFRRVLSKARLRTHSLRLDRGVAEGLPGVGVGLLTTPAGLRALVHGLRRTGVLSAQEARRLGAEVAAYAAARTLGGHATARARLRVLAARAQGETRTFLFTAISQLLG